MAGSSNGFVENGNFTPKVLYSSANPPLKPASTPLLSRPRPPHWNLPGDGFGDGNLRRPGTSVSVSYDGYGYISAPSVTITSRERDGAVARAVISGGYVTGITVSGAGSHYPGGVAVTIAPPSGLPQGTG